MREPITVSGSGAAVLGDQSRPLRLGLGHS